MRARKCGDPGGVQEKGGVEKVHRLQRKKGDEAQCRRCENQGLHQGARPSNGKWILFCNYQADDEHN